MARPKTGNIKEEGRQVHLWMTVEEYENLKLSAEYQEMSVTTFLKQSMKMNPAWVGPKEPAKK